MFFAVDPAADVDGFNRRDRFRSRERGQHRRRRAEYSNRPD
jgi:hypothetical protein